MEQTLTPAGRVRRLLKAGRPPKILNKALSPFDAVAQIVREADRARNLMHNENLDPDDIQLSLIYCTPENSGGEEIGVKPLPKPDRIGRYVEFFENVARKTPVLFLGILWEQKDREATPDVVKWVTQFVAGPEAEKRLRAARDYAASLKH